MSHDHVPQSSKRFCSSSSTSISSVPRSSRCTPVTHFPLLGARRVPGEMAEQHGAPEQAAAGKSHGGLGGSYKVRGGKGSQRLQAWGCSWASGSASPAGSWPPERETPASHRGPERHLTPFTPLLHPLSCVLIWRTELDTRSLSQWGTEAPGVSGDVARTLLPDLSPVLWLLWASTAPPGKWNNARCLSPPSRR